MAQATNSGGGHTIEVSFKQHKAPALRLLTQVHCISLARFAQCLSGEVETYTKLEESIGSFKFIKSLALKIKHEQADERHIS